MTDCVLCRSPLACVGCCGRRFGSHHELALVVLQNSHELREAESLVAFRDRTPHLRHGLCANVVFLPDGTVGCPLHPARNAQDLRKGHCDAEHLCETAKRYNLWSRDQQQAFIAFLKRSGLSWYDYSIGLDNGSLLKRFLARRARRATS